MLKNKLKHLPDRKQEEIKHLVSLICDHYSPATIILFGSYARGNWVEEKFEEDVPYHRYQSDFDVLVLVPDRSMKNQRRLEEYLEDLLNESEKIETPVTILVHDLHFINAQLAKCQYFFSDIRREGILIYGEDLLLKKAKKLSDQERAKLAKEDFEYWFESVNDFYDQFLFSFKKGRLNVSAFSLHQTAEKLYTTMLLVYTRYKPNTHDLRKLRKIVNAFDKRFSEVFLLDTPDKKRLFNLLRSAYVDARYKKTYVITQDELAQLQKEVNKLQRLTDTLCHEKITSLASTKA